MLFHTFGDNSKKTVLLIHGALTPWQIWDNAIETFSKDYFVIVPELDAHTEDKATSFQSVEEEAKEIIDYIIKTREGKSFLICGLSMGGRIAACIANSSELSIENLILDGAPLLPLPKLMIKIMTRNYLAIIRESKKRERKVLENFKKNFLPEKYLEAFLKLADNMGEASIKNMVSSVFSKFDYKKYDSSCRILFMHGSKGNEALAKKSAAKMKKINPQTEIKCFKGYSHAQLACFEAEKWTREVDKWLRG